MKGQGTYFTYRDDMPKFLGEPGRGPKRHSADEQHMQRVTRSMSFLTLSGTVNEHQMSDDSAL